MVAFVQGFMFMFGCICTIVCIALLALVIGAIIDVYRFHNSSDWDDEGDDKP